MRVRRAATETLAYWISGGWTGSVMLDSLELQERQVPTALMGRMRVIWCTTRKKTDTEVQHDGTR